jgi:hypothetical protein
MKVIAYIALSMIALGVFIVTGVVIFTMDELKLAKGQLQTAAATANRWVKKKEQIADPPAPVATENNQELPKEVQQ